MRVLAIMHIVERLRVIGATVAAAAAGALSIATGGSRREVTLARGDLAPGFTLTGSDGRTYSLDVLLGRGETIVIAWFPKAFTSG